MAEINRPKEFQKGTAGVPESTKESARGLPEGSDIGLGPGDRAFEPHYSDHNVETKKMSPAKSPNISGFFATQTAIFLCTKTQM